MRLRLYLKMKWTCDPARALEFLPCEQNAYTHSYICDATPKYYTHIVLVATIISPMIYGMLGHF